MTHTFLQEESKVNTLKILRMMVVGAIAFAIVASSPPTAQAGDLDVYIVYSGKNKQAKKALVNALGPGVSVKAYNADLLALADYSGMQKAVAKIEQAKMVVILSDRPMELLKGSTLKQNLIIVGSMLGTVVSSKRCVRVLPLDLKPAAAEAGMKVLAQSRGELLAGEIGDGVVVAGADGFDVYAATSAVVGRLLGS